MVLVQDFMSVLVVCKFEEDRIKTEGGIVSIFFQCSRADNSEVNEQMCPEFELFFMYITIQQSEEL